MQREPDWQKKYWLVTSLLAVLCFAEADDSAFTLVCDEVALDSQKNGGSVVKLNSCKFYFSILLSNFNVFSISDCVVSGQSNISFVDDGMR